jgi:hypothetical protein
MCRQGELLQQMAVNRYRLGVVLGAALEDMPAQAQRAAQFASWEAEINAYHAVSCVCFLLWGIGLVYVYSSGGGVWLCICCGGIGFDFRV